MEVALAFRKLLPALSLSSSSTLTNIHPAMASTEPITAFVSFPSPYTETLLVRALAATLPAVSISNDPPSEENPPKLQW